MISLLRKSIKFFHKVSNKKMPRGAEAFSDIIKLKLLVDYGQFFYNHLPGILIINLNKIHAS